jgi:diaminopimelate decarboxylase
LQEAGFADRYKILFAMKANRFAPLLSALKQSGLCGIDACSPQEVEHALACGFRARDISFTAGSLSEQDVRALARHPRLGVNCDSIHSIRAWGKLRPESSIGIRVNPGIGVSRADNEKLQYAGNAISKFGIYREQFDEALAVARNYGLSVSKIHFHTGCGYLTPQLKQWDQVISSCMWFIDRCKSINTVNVGGGLGVPHLAGEEPLDLTAWAGILEKHFEKREIRIEIEPGEYLLKDAGLLVLGKTYLEQKRDRMFLGVDGGFNIAPEPAYYGLPLQPLPLQYDRGAELAPLTVVGNINEALDVWYDNAPLPDMGEQQFLALLNAGAYSSSMASNHCMRGQFKEYLLD